MICSAGILSILLAAVAVPTALAEASGRPIPSGIRAVTLQDSTGVVRGRVVRAGSRPGATAVVVLQPGARRTVAGADGAFRFDAVKRGAYTIRATIDTSLFASRRITVRGGDTVDVELRVAAAQLPELKVKGDRPLRTTASAATKTDAPILETPYSLSVIDSHQLEVQRPLSLNEALRYSAGVQAEQFGGVDNGFDFFVVRGFSGVSTGIFRDGVQLATPGFVGFRVEPYGTESIEVLRGAASVLAGQSNPGGMVNAVTKRAPQVPVREVILEGGSFGTAQGQFDLGGPVGNGGFSYRITGLARSAGTQVQFGKNDRLFVAPAIAWYGTTTTIDANFQLQRDNVGHFQFLPASGTYLPNPNGFIPVDRNDGEPGFNRFPRHQLGVGYRIEHRIGQRLTLRQTGRFDHVSAEFDAVFGNGLDPADSTQRTLLRSAFTAAGVTDAFTVDNQAQLRVGGARTSGTILAGIDYQHYRFAETDGVGDAPSLDVFTPTYGATIVRPAPYADATTTRGQTGLYLNARTLIEKRLAVSGGVRQNFLSSRTVDRLADTTTSQNNNKLRVQTGVAYLSPVGLVPHVSYSESFLPVVGLDANGDPFKPETGRQYEAGLRYQPLGRGIAFAAAAFDLLRQNVTTPSLANPLLQVQTGAVRSRGVELEASGRVATGLTIISALTLQDVTVTSSNAGDLGKRPPATANSLASLWMDYDGARGPLGGIGVGAGVRYQGPTFGDPENTFAVSGYALMDAMLHYDWGRARLALNAQNVFDKRHIAACNGAGPSATCYYGRARMLLASLRYRW